ncbi:MAG: hypothetical protein V1809_12820 [Planctomycetota bacterium]
MLNVKERYLVDPRGNATAVVLDVGDYRKILARLEDVEDAKRIRAHLGEKLIPMETVHRSLEKQGLV